MIVKDAMHPDAVGSMERNRIRRLPAIDEHRRTIGVLSPGDVAAKTPLSLTAETPRAFAVRHA